MVSSIKNPGECVEKMLKYVNGTMTGELKKIQEKGMCFLLLYEIKLAVHNISGIDLWIFNSFITTYFERISSMKTGKTKYQYESRDRNY